MRTTLGILLIIWIFPHEAQALGRLFFTPAERRELSHGYASAVSEVPAIPKAATLMKVNGWLESGRRKRLWLNGRMRVEGASPAGLRVSDEVVRLRWQGRWLEMKPGQVVHKGLDGNFRIDEFNHE